MTSPLDFFMPQLQEPPNYEESLPNFENAYICANISQLCYLSSVNAKRMDIGYEEAVRSTLKNWGCSQQDAQKTFFIESDKITNEDGTFVSGTEGLIIFHDKTVIIGFRGSEKKPDDWGANFKIRARPFDFGEGKVHRGFVSAFKAIVPYSGPNVSKFEDVINNIKNAQSIWLTGHSLGGALAIVAANYLVHKKINVSGVYSFGAPRVGNGTYRNYVNEKLTYKYWRFMYENDIVPDLPPPGLIYRYSREGCMLRLNKTGDTQEFDVLRRVNAEGKRIRLASYRGISVDDHSISNYSDRLFDLVRQNDKDFPRMEFETLSDDGKLNGLYPGVAAFQKRAIFSLLEQNVAVEIIAKGLQVDPKIVQNIKDSLDE
ncbi:MAG: lipase family protein [Crocosphaera sp.]